MRLNARGLWYVTPTCLHHFVHRHRSMTKCIGIPGSMPGKTRAAGLAYHAGNGFMAFASYSDVSTNRSHLPFGLLNRFSWLAFARLPHVRLI